MAYALKNDMYDELVFHIDSYVASTKYPTLMGLMVHLRKYTDNYYRDAELQDKLELYLLWLEQEEKYEKCAFVHTMIKENASRSF